MITTIRRASALLSFASLTTFSACGGSGGIASAPPPGGNNPPPAGSGGTLQLQVPPSFTAGSLFYGMVATNDGVYVRYSGAGGKDYIAKYSVSADTWWVRSFPGNSVQDFAPVSRDNDIGEFRFSALIKHEDLPISSVPQGVADWVVHTGGFGIRFDSPIRSQAKKAGEAKALALSGGGMTKAWVRTRYLLAAETQASNASGRFWDFYEDPIVEPIKASVVQQWQGRIAGDPDAPYLWAATPTGFARIQTVQQDKSWTLPVGNGLGRNSKIVVLGDAHEADGYTDEVWADFGGRLYRFDGSEWLEVLDLDMTGGSVLNRAFGVGPDKVFFANGRCVDRTAPFQEYEYLRDPAPTDPGYAEWFRNKIAMAAGTYIGAHPERDRVYVATRDGVLVVTPMDAPVPTT